MDGHFAIPCGLVFLFLFFLAERIVLDSRRKKIPFRIAVTGTRGKSSVVRLIAAALREAGYRVMAKTTGSLPVLIYPDGSEREIKRRGQPSILEQKKVIAAARRVGADVLVAEMMSIRPETLAVESAKLIKPQILAITNVRLDHTDAMGQTKSEIARSLAAAIPRSAKVFAPAAENYPAFASAAFKNKSRLFLVPGASVENESLEKGSLFQSGFPENISLALAVAEELGLPKNIALKGMSKTNPDFGGLKIWKMVPKNLKAPWCLVSAFAANEPESTEKALRVLHAIYSDLPRTAIALLNLRADRGDRTEQWLQAIEEGFFTNFSHLAFIGGHARALGHRKSWKHPGQTRIFAFVERRPPQIMEKVFALAPDGALLVGLGNVGGLGGALIRHWSETGVAL